MKKANLALSPHNYRGKLLSVDGVDGTGKTTMVNMLQRWFADKEQSTYFVKLPSKEVRNLTIFRRAVDAVNDQQRAQVSTEAWLLVAVSDILQHLHEVILPYLKVGTHVICERYFYTTIAEALVKSPEFLYTDAGKSLKRIIETYGIHPDLSLMMHTGAQLAYQRILARPEEKKRNIDYRYFQQRIAMYQVIAKANDLSILDTSLDDALSTNFHLIHRKLDNLLPDNTVQFVESIT